MSAPSHALARVTRGRALVAAIALALLLALAGGALADWRWGSAAPPAVRLVGRLPPARRIAFTLDLVLPGQRALDRSLAAIEDPRSPQFGRFIGARAFGERYGLSSRRLAVLDRALGRDGLRIEESYPQRTALRVSGSVAAVTRLFGSAIGSFADRAGDRWRAPLSTPVIPRSLVRLVSGVSGLSTRPLWQAADVPSSGLTPPGMRIAYDLAPLVRMNILGQGQTVAILALSDYDRSDPANFASEYGIKGRGPTVIKIDGGTSDTSGAIETDLDIEMVRSVAPDARVLVYEAPDSPNGIEDVLNRIVADHSASIVSTSWGACIPHLGPGQQANEQKVLSAAVRVGISVFASSGDSGAYDCQRASLADQRLTVDWPAASADAIAVGGTRLYLNADGSYGHEAGWEGALSQTGGGGGLATGVPRPPWQTGPGVQSSASNGQRQVPDVSADADTGTPWAIYTSGPASGSGSFTPGGPTQVGGTSAATPFWAASMALVQQYATSKHAGPLGFVDPMLYSIAAGGARFPAFHDVTLGGNRHYQATPGWDFATGLGSPDVYNLARDAVAYLLRR